MFISTRHEMGRHHRGEGGKGRQCSSKTTFRHKKILNMKNRPIHYTFTDAAGLKKFEGMGIIFVPPALLQGSTVGTTS